MGIWGKYESASPKSTDDETGAEMENERQYRDDQSKKVKEEIRKKQKNKNKHLIWQKKPCERCQVGKHCWNRPSTAGADARLSLWLSNNNSSYFYSAFSGRPAIQSANQRSYSNNIMYIIIFKNRTQVPFVVFSYFDIKIRIFPNLTKYRNGWQDCIIISMNKISNKMTKNSVLQHKLFTSESVE